jgi:phosphatidylinositol alpha-1,6-mannosyltransferase
MTQSEPFPILMFCWNFPPAIGGIESVADHLSRAWRERGCAVSVVARYSSERFADKDIFRPENPGLLRYLWHAWKTGAKLISLRRPSVLVCAGIVDAPLAWLLARRFRIPYVVLAHGSDISRRGFIYQRVVRFLFRRADAIAANSAHTKMLLERAGCDVQRIRILHPGVDGKAEPSNAPSDLRARYQLSAGPVLLTSGRVIRRKGIGEFIDHVLSDLIKSFPNLNYVVVGEDATESLAHKERLLAQIKDQVEQAGLIHHVRFPGKVSDEELKRWYELADVFVLPGIPIAGDIEGFGIVLLEANLYQTPVVATRIGGVPDAVVDGVTGRLVEPENWSAIRDAIAELLQDEELRQKMGEAGCQRAQQVFNWTVIGQKYVNWLTSVVEQSSGYSA